VFAKFDFKITSDDSIINLKLNCPTDKYLLDYMRMKIVDKSADLHQAGAPITLHSTYIENMSLPQNDVGYCFIIEGNMPYNTNEGQLTIDVNTSQETFDFTEAVGCEPVEYSDKYEPSKYGIIFKEKVYISPTDHTSTAINIKLLKDGVEFRDADLMKHYFFQILDNDKIILDKQGWNQINLSHYLFRCNAGLPESGEEGEEVKHNYVIQAVFDLHLWPECKTANEQSEGISWCVKVFNSDTLALCKDTDKEDKEKALKASWEVAEPGRAEKASSSRRRFQLQLK